MSRPDNKSRPDNTTKPPRFGDIFAHYVETTIPMYQAHLLVVDGVWRVPPERRPKDWQTKYPEIKEPVVEQIPT